MATMDQLMTALRAADAAGNTQDATRIAQIIKGDQPDNNSTGHRRCFRLRRRPCPAAGWQRHRGGRQSGRVRGTSPDRLRHRRPARERHRSWRLHSDLHWLTR